MRNSVVQANTVQAFGGGQLAGARAVASPVAASMVSNRKAGADLFSIEWWCACIGICALTLSVRGGDAAIGIYLLCCIAIFARAPITGGFALFRFSPLMALPALALLSWLWSEAPEITGKQALELLLFFLTVIILCRPLRLLEMAAALQLGILACCVLNLVVQPNALSGVPLVGLMGSKNQASFTAQLLLLSSLPVASSPKMPRALRIGSLGCVALGALETHLAQSAGGLLSSVAAAAAFACLALIGRVRLPTRVATIIGGMVAVSPLLVVASDVVQQVQDFQIKVLHKDATLTGRTEIWGFARSLIAERPIIGHGFDAFWRQGNEDAEGLWQRFGIGSRMGFNFHNQFVDTQVDFGMVGLVVLVGSLLLVAIPAVWRSIRMPSLGNAFAISILVALYMKLPVESVLIGAWNAYTLAFLMVAVSGALGAKAGGAELGPRGVARPT
jgi:exopolysaccharide production protein ExoQ